MEDSVRHPAGMLPFTATCTGNELQIAPCYVHPLKHSFGTFCPRLRGLRGGEDRQSPNPLQ